MYDTYLLTYFYFLPPQQITLKHFNENGKKYSATYIQNEKVPLCIYETANINFKWL